MSFVNCFQQIELKKKRNALFKEKEQRTDLKFKSDAELTQLKSI